MVDEDTSPTAPASNEPTQPVSEQAAPETPTAQIPASEPLPPQLESTPPTQNQASQPTSSPAPTNFARDLLDKARATIQFRKTAKLEKIMTALQKKNHITNDEVEKLLHVSDATATRYLEALVKQGKIKKIGTTGKAVTYTKL